MTNKKILNNHNYVLIMAGGAGTRLFPRSTEKLPKQFQKIIGDKTLIEQTYDRVKKIVDDDHIYISSHSSHLNLLRKYFPKIPDGNFIVEPVRKNTGPAMALATAIIYSHDKDAIIITNASDHLILREDEYATHLLGGVKTIQNNRNHILCVGIIPTLPHTGLGYIEKGKEFSRGDDFVVYKGKKFVEKPSLRLAEKYLSSGNFFWNASYFIWSADHFLNEVKRCDPKMFLGVKKIVKAQKSKDYQKVLNKEFNKFKNIAVDYLVMEKTKNLLILPSNMGWSDIGNWDIVDTLNSRLRDKNGNYIEGYAININTRNTTILSHNDKVIATIGLNNFIIVSTEEALIIVPKGQSEHIKKVVEKLTNKGLK